MKIIKNNMAHFTSYQNLIFIQNLYRLQSIGFNYIDTFNINDKKYYDTPFSFTQLSQDVQNCHLCDLSKSRSQAMVGFGNENADIMVIDFNISDIQDKNNLYYNGRTGELLKEILEKSLKTTVEKIYYTHSIKCKTLNFNFPSSSEWNSCKNHLYSQINFIKPKFIISLGEDVYKNLTSDEENFENIRGHLIEFNNYKLLPIYHPKHILRNPELKNMTLNDLKKIESYL